MAELAEVGITAEAKPGGRAQLDVVTDDVVTFSKQATGRFPRPGEITELLRG